MKKTFKLLLLFILAVVIFSPVVSFAENKSNNLEADVEKISFTLFHTDSCPHCKDEIDFIDRVLRPSYGVWVDFKLYEINNRDNQLLFKRYGEYYNADVRGVPLTFIEGDVVYGYKNEKTSGVEIINIIEKALNEKGFLQNNIELETEERVFFVPALGEVNLEKFSLPLLSFVIGLLDGFNPCAMWVLLFLISLLLGMESKKRMWLLGSLFIFTSGFVYFLFMTAWLKFLMFIGMLFYVRLIIGSVAVGVGAYNLKDFWNTRKAEGVVCKVGGRENTKKIFNKIREIVYRRSLWWSVLGIIILGFSVNLVELACSAGFPAIFTQILAISDVSMWQRYMYMIIYIIAYIIDDLFVFFVAMVTLRSKTVGSRFAKYSNLIGGVLILILGLLLIFKPEWLMFG